MLRYKALFVCFGLVLLLTLSGFGMVSAQDDDTLNFTVIRDSDSLTIYTPGGTPFSLSGLSIEVFTPDGQIELFPLDEYPALALVASRPIPTELCIQLVRAGATPDTPEQCANVSTQFTLIQNVDDTDVFWYDVDTDTLLTFSLLQNDEFVGFCQTAVCEFSTGTFVVHAVTEAPATEAEPTIPPTSTNVPTILPTNTQAPPTSTATPTLLPPTSTLRPTETAVPNNQPTKAPAPTEGGIQPGDPLGETSEWGVSGRVLALNSWDSSAWEDIVDELRDLGLIPRGNLVFNERGEVWRAGSGFLTVPLARNASHQNVVMGGTLTFDIGAPDEIEYCTLSLRMVIQGNSITRVAGIGLLNNEGQEELLYLDNNGTGDDDFYSTGVLADLDASPSFHVVVIADNNTMTAFINGQLAFEQEPLSERFGVYGLTLFGASPNSRCETENTWVYQFD